MFTAKIKIFVNVVFLRASFVRYVRLISTTLVNTNYYSLTYICNVQSQRAANKGKLTMHCVIKARLRSFENNYESILFELTKGIMNA